MTVQKESVAFGKLIGAKLTGDRDFPQLDSLFQMGDKLLMIKVTRKGLKWGLAGKWIDKCRWENNKSFYCVFFVAPANDNVFPTGWIFPLSEIKNNIDSNTWKKRVGTVHAYDASAPFDDSFKFTTKDEFYALLK